jgi:hypothetical protein
MTNINILYAKNSFEFSLFIVIIFEIYILIGKRNYRKRYTEQDFFFSNSLAKKASKLLIN